MARIVVGSWLVRYPLGGNLSWGLQYLVGLHKLGHEVYLVEKSGWRESCFDPVRGGMTDDCSYGTGVVDDLLRRKGLAGRWCFVDHAGSYHGLDRRQVEEVTRSADLFIDIGAHGDWDAESAAAGLRVLIDGEPGFTQMKMEQGVHKVSGNYDFFYTTGSNIGTPRSTAPDGGRHWNHLFHPVVVDMFAAPPSPAGSAFTTVMNWQSYAPLRHRGASYGHKDVEFERFLGLPRLVSSPMEVAVSGRVPGARLEEAGWRVRSAHAATSSFESFRRYVEGSLGEFSVCKHGYVATASGWFSDRSAVYLASGRPVVMQDTGFGSTLPCGQGLFAVRSMDEAVDAIAAITGDYDRHSKWAREIAWEHLDARKVLGRLLTEIGL